MLTSVTPRFGTVVGNTDVTFTGNGLSSVINDYSIILDGINCVVIAATSTSVTCTTGSRPGLVLSSQVITIANQGTVSNNDFTFTYVSVWSSETTWGGEFEPMDGETVYIPEGFNLLVDVDNSPKLNAVVVEGRIIFASHDDPLHQRTFDARYIFVNGGAMEVGTEDFPYTSKITITMHGNVYDPYLPIYGNKVIGVRYGTLDMHGVPRSPSWTVMETTSQVGATTITLRDAVDWQVGEQIGIAPTDYEARHAEKRYIVAIDRTNPAKPILTLDKALTYKRFAETQTFGG